MPGDSSCSQWVEQSEREVVISHGSGCRATRSGNLIEKGLTYKKETFRERERRRKVSGRLRTIGELLFSSKNVIAVEEEMKQFNDLFKISDAHQEYKQLGDVERGRDDDWFDDGDTQVCSFKRKVHCWLREAAQRTKSSKGREDKGSMNSEKSKDSHESRSSRTSRETRSSKLLRDREIEEKMKVAELIAKAELLQQANDSE